MATTRQDILKKIEERKIRGIQVLSGVMEEDAPTTSSALPAGFITTLPAQVGTAYKICERI